MNSGLLTVSDAREFLGRFVDAGSCTPAVIDSRIYEACRRLLRKSDWVHSTRVVRIRTDRKYFPLPRECEAIRWANVCGAPARIFGPAYEFVNAGPGEIRHMTTSTGFKNLVDAGVFPTMYDIPSIETFALDAKPTERTLGQGFYIAAFSTQNTDAGKKLTLRGTDRLNNELGSGVTFDGAEQVDINPWMGGTEGMVASGLAALHKSSRRYRELTDWTKPVTGGYISVYAIDPDTNFMYFLAKAHPLDTKPVWRRYKIAGEAFTNDHANILTICKLKVVPFTADDDVLPIQNLDALKSMVMAIKFENDGNMQAKVVYEANAVALLDEQQGDHDKNAGMPVIIDHQLEMTGAVLGHRPI